MKSESISYALRESCSVPSTTAIPLLISDGDVKNQAFDMVICFVIQPTATIKAAAKMPVVIARHSHCLTQSEHCHSIQEPDSIQHSLAKQKSQIL